MASTVPITDNAAEKSLSTKYYHNDHWAGYWKTRRSGDGGGRIIVNRIAIVEEVQMNMVYARQWSRQLRIATSAV